MRTHDIKAALRRFYKPSEFALMFEVGNTTGTGVARHADAIAMNLWPSRGMTIEGVEIKVSRSDWRRELDNPAKSEPVQKFCDQWWIVAPEGIVQEIELPALWGLRVVSPNLSIRTVKVAPKLDAMPPSRGFIAAMLRRASEADAAEVNALVEAKLIAERSRIEERVAAEVKKRTAKMDKIEATIAKLKEIGINANDYHFDPGQIADDIRLGHHMRKNYSLGGLNNTAKRLEEAAQVLHEVHSLLSPESSES